MKKIRLAVHSDLHEEFKPMGENFLTDKKFDVLVLAGDITVGPVRLDTFLSSVRKKIKTKPIIYVPGNHEYYGSTFTEFNQEATRICKKHNVHYGFRNTFPYGDYLFICATGWSIMRGSKDRNPYHVSVVGDSIGDFRAIKKWTTNKMIANGEHDMRAIMKGLRTAELQKRFPIVVTHFPITSFTRNQNFAESPLTDYFENRYGEPLLNKNIKMIFGHNHENFVTKYLADEYFITNQRGYPREGLYAHKPNYIYEFKGKI